MNVLQAMPGLALRFGRKQGTCDLELTNLDVPAMHDVCDHCRTAELAGKLDVNVSLAV